MAQQSDEELQQELQDDYVDNETKKGTAIGMGLGAVAGGAAGVAIGAEAGAALVVGSAVVSAPVVIPALIGAGVIGAVGTGIAHVSAKNEKIEALDRHGKKLSLKGAEQQLLARMRETETIKQQKKCLVIIHTSFLDLLLIYMLINIFINSKRPGKEEIIKCNEKNKGKYEETGSDI